MGDLLSPMHVILIVFVVLLLFGGKKIPELMRGLGKGMREFKDAKDNVQREIEEHVKDDRKTTSSSAGPANSTNSTTTAATTSKPVSSDSSVHSN